MVENAPKLVEKGPKWSKWNLNIVKNGQKRSKWNLNIFLNVPKWSKWNLNIVQNGPKWSKWNLNIVKIGPKMFETVPKIVEKAQNGQSGTSTLSRVAQKWLKTLMAERGIETTQN